MFFEMVEVFVCSQKHDLMEHVAHQTICMQFILELAKQLDYDPRACVDAFFSKIQVAEPEYKASFNDELEQFKERIRKRAAEKIEEALRVIPCIHHHKDTFSPPTPSMFFFLGSRRRRTKTTFRSRRFRSSGGVREFTR